MQINSLKDLTKVGSVLNKDFREPSIFDLEDIQDPSEALIASSNSVSSFSSTSALSFSTNISNNSSKMKLKDQSDEIGESAKSDNSSDDLNYDDEEDQSKADLFDSKLKYYNFYFVNLISIDLFEIF